MPAHAITLPPAERAAVSTPFLKFMLAGQGFAVAIGAVREVIEYRPITDMPMAPPSVCGVINLRGTVVPVVDLHRRFGWPPGTIGKRTCIVILEASHPGGVQLCGLLVDAVCDVVVAADMLPPPSLGLPLAREFVRGTLGHDEHFLMVLDTARVLAVSDPASDVPAAACRPVTDANAADAGDAVEQPLDPQSA